VEGDPFSLDCTAIVLLRELLSTVVSVAAQLEKKTKTKQDKSIMKDLIVTYYA
jgi:hypothetical protein